MRRGPLTLKPQDIVVLLKLSLHADAWTFAGLSRALAISASEVHSSLERCAAARLYDRDTRTVHRASLLTFLEHGVRFAFPAWPGPPARGVPTAPAHNNSLPLVWPDPAGDTDGLAVQPLYRTAPQAARADAALHRALVLTDTLRLGDDALRAPAVAALRQLLVPDTTSPALRRLLGDVDEAAQVPAERWYDSAAIRAVIVQLAQDPTLLAQARGEAVEPLRAWATALLRHPEHTFVLAQHLPPGPDTGGRLARLLRTLQDLTAP